MLAKYYRFRFYWDADQNLTYDDGARINIRVLPWKLTSSGALSYSTVITDDFGFGAGDGIPTAGGSYELESSVIDNTSNLYMGFNGYIEVTADLSSTDGIMYLFMEEADVDQESPSYWPSDQDDFDVQQDLIFLCALQMSTDAVDESRGKNFEY